MKKSFFKTAIFAMATAALIFAGCNSDSGGGGDYPEITKTTISGIPESAVSGPVELTADVDGNNLEGAEIEYSWEFAEESGYASFENSDAKTSKLVPNCAAEEKEVKIKVTATLKGTENRKSSEVYPVKIAAKQESGAEGSGSGNGSGTGSVSAVVNADGSISCGKCGKIYNFTEQAKNCEHYKCATCGSVYYSQSEVDSCTSHVTVIFKDSGENGNESVTMVIKSGSTVIPPSWEKENFALTWIDENGKEADFDDLISLSEGESEKTVTFTAKWETTYTVTFKDESGTNADVTVDVISGEVVGSVPEWTREHFTFAGWTSSVSGLTTDSVIKGDVTFTANWTEDAKYTVKFVDSDGANAEDIQTVYNGEKANVPAWTKENYSLSWTSSVEGLTTDSVITGDVTFTANWTELPKCTNCGTHYATADAANNCGKQEGCPKYGALTTITFSGTKTATVSSDNDAITAVVIGNVTKTDYVYNGEKYNPLLKMESSTSLKLTGVKNKKITIITCGYKTATKRNIKVAGTNYAASENDEVIIEDISDDEIEITKGDQLNVAVIFIE
ncbi:InlB B-repeat-containing protein [Treponema berlinense]|uniref:InlB B-repeat-containing protein n=1 Tax=Treponema berlinense TaxID=225004 RepID=UPI002356E611|nr:InlB B-repeat-containing protein [Treponema berlinense]